MALVVRSFSTLIMLRSTLTGIVAFAVLLSHVQARLSSTGAQGINLQRLDNAKQEKLLTDVVNAATFPVYNFTQPLDHFTDTGFTWNQRYWVSTRHYKQGGPVVVFEAGEGPGDVRIPILDTGIVNILTNATGGLGIILEHRYYGESVPVQNFTTDSLRWLNNEQAAADSAYFMSHVKFEGIPHDLTAPGTPWIYYGGSYGGARAAHMRVLYPNVTFGAIASSGVTHATLDDWRYYDIIRQYAPSNCMAQVVKSIVEFDDLIANPSTHHAVKALFGLPNVTHDADVASILSAPLGAWQDTNWDPAVSTTDFATFCNALGTPDSKTISTSQGITVSSALANYATYINETFASDCPAPATQDECFGTYDASAYQATDLSQTWRLWTFQVCTQWGFFSTPPPDPSRPRIISRLITEEYSSMICRLAYPPGKFFQVPPQPNITAVNALGGYNIAADRLAIIDGQADPWRGDTPHSPEAKNRTDTIIRPFKLIPGAVHHWDENGLADPSAEPPTIHAIHQQEIEFVKAWLQDFKSPKDTA